MADTIAAVDADSLIDLVYALKRPYRRNASFIMNDATIAAVRKLKDSNGAYIWQPSYQSGEPDRVLGYPVHTSGYAPADGIVYFSSNVLHLELYTDKKDVELEETVEAALTGQGLYYEKNEVWIESERLYEVLYEMEV